VLRFQSHIACGSNTLSTFFIDLFLIGEPGRPAYRGLYGSDLSDLRNSPVRYSRTEAYLSSEDLLGKAFLSFTGSASGDGSWFSCDPTMVFDDTQRLEEDAGAHSFTRSSFKSCSLWLWHIASWLISWLRRPFPYDHVPGLVRTTPWLAVVRARWAS